MLYVAAFKRSVVYVVIFLFAISILKTVDSIAVTPSVYVTDHVREPHRVFVQLPEQFSSATVQLKTLAVLVTLYVKAGAENLVELIDSTSDRHRLVTTMVKSFVIKTVG